MINIQKIISHLMSASGVEQTSRFHLENYREHVLMVFNNLFVNGADKRMLLAALLHDIGKPSTAVNRPGKGWTFYNHEVVGAGMIKEFISEDDPSYEFVVDITKWHMLPFGLSAPEPWGGQNRAAFDKLPASLKADVLAFNKADAAASISSQEELDNLRKEIPAMEANLGKFLSSISDALGV